MECRIRLRGPGEVIRLLYQLVERQRFLSQSAYEPTGGCQTPCEFLHISESSWQSHFLYGANLYRICFDSSIRHEEAEQLSCGALRRIKLHAISSQVIKCFSYIV